MKLRTKFALVLLIVTLLLSGAVYGGLEFYEGQTRDRTQANVNQTTQLAAQQIESAIRERIDYVGLVASRPEAARFDRSDEYLDSILDSTRFFAAQVVDENGTVVSFRGAIDQTVRQETVGQNVSNETYFTGALTQGVHVTDPQFVDSSGEYIVVISAPIFENRSVAGVLAASIYVTEETFFDSIVPVDTASRRVTIRHDDAFLYYSEQRLEQGIEATASIEPVGWTLTVTRDQSILNKQLEGLALVQSGGLLAVLLSVVVFGVWEYRENLQQTHRLLDGFSRLQDGVYDAPLDLSTSHEWMEISEGFNDLAEGLARREAELRDREQRLQVLNRVLRHNLRNDMSVVLNSADLIARVADRERVTEAADRISNTGTRLVETGEKARRLETLLGDSTRREIDLVPLVNSVVADLRDTHPDARLQFQHPETALVEVNRGVEFAVENLLENAVVHNDGDEPRVDITVERTDDAVRLVVADDGPGIPEHELDVLAEGSETPLEHGSGLGLWAAQWAVENSGGDLAFDITDDGTTAVIVFPPVRARDGEGERDPTGGSDSSAQ